MDPEFTFTFSGGGSSGFGVLSAVNSGLGDGSLHVIAGSLTVTSSSDGNASVGTYTLLPAGPGITTSPSGAFLVDNLIYPANNAFSGVNPGFGSNPSFLTNFGLLFGPPSTGSQQEINIWGNGNGDFAFFTFNNGYNIQTGSGVTFTLAPVPEPSGLVVFGAATLAGVAFCGWRRRKQPLPA